MRYRRSLGRRRFSWESKRNQNRTKQAPSGFGGLIVLLAASYIFIRPIFWLVAATLTFIAACLIIMGLCKLWERFNQPVQQFKSISDNEDAWVEKAIGIQTNRAVADLASQTLGGNMTHDSRLALIDSDGDPRFPAIIDDTFQIGKDRKRKPTNIEEFTRAILIEGEDGRVVCGDGRKPGILKFSGKAQEARSYRLAPSIAAKLGIPTHGSR